MKYIYSISILLSLSLVQLHGQNERIQNTQLRLDGDRLVITYDITPGGTIGEISIVFRSTTGQPIVATSLTGDVGQNILPGQGKRVEWNMASEKIELGGQELKVTVMAKTINPISTTSTLVEEVSLLKKIPVNLDKIEVKNGKYHYGILESKIPQNGQYIMTSRDNKKITFEKNDVLSISYTDLSRIKNILYLRNGSQVTGQILKIIPSANLLYFNVKSVGDVNYNLPDVARIETHKRKKPWALIIFGTAIVGSILGSIAQ